jgi:hypothetical protein
MRAGSRIYHTKCFRCYICNKQLEPGEEYAMREEGLLCKIDNEVSEKSNGSIITQASLNQIVSTQPPPNASVSSLHGQQMSQASSSVMIMSTSCQNITNLQQPTASMMGANKMMLKCGDDMNGQADYEGNILVVFAFLLLLLLLLNEAIKTIRKSLKK